MPIEKYKHFIAHSILFFRRNSLDLWNNQRIGNHFYTHYPHHLMDASASKTRILYSGFIFFLMVIDAWQWWKYFSGLLCFIENPFRSSLSTVRCTRLRTYALFHFLRAMFAWAHQWKRCARSHRILLKQRLGGICLRPNGFSIIL